MFIHNTTPHNIDNTVQKRQQKLSVEENPGREAKKNDTALKKKKTTIVKRSDKKENIINNTVQLTIGHNKKTTRN